MFKKNILLLLVIVQFSCITSIALSDSLWTEKSESSYVITKAHKPGDVLTIIVEEQTSALQSGSTQSDRDSNVQFNLQNAFSGTHSGKETSGEDKLGLDMTGSNKYRGVGKTMRNSTVKTTITATVIDVQPNGNLFVMGQRQLDINSEMQKIEISGIVRKADISPQNTIYSSQIANAKISIRGSGPVSSPQNTGLFGKLFGWLF